MDDLALRAAADAANLFCRVTPTQKNRIVAALKARGHVVGYLGDGANDAPPLHSADVGISVDGAVDVAKQAADLVLLRHDLGVLIDGLREGRRTLLNVDKYVRMATSSNFGNMVSMALATLFLPFLPMRPLQILLNNFLYDVSELALPLDRVADAQLQQRQRWDIGAVRRFMLSYGPMSSLFDLAAFVLLVQWFHAGVPTFQTAWFVQSMATQVLVIFVIRTPGAAWRDPPSPWVTGSSLAVTVLAFALPWLPGAAALGFVPLAPPVLAMIGALTLGYLLAAEGLKRWLNRRRAVPPQAAAALAR
jgi:Mg2+-importing ATPase